MALAEALRDGDVLLSNHRGHGHFLAGRPDLVKPLLAEIMGLDEGLCGGIGGSQHLHAEGFYSNGVQGGMTPVAAGIACAKKLYGTDDIVAVCIGDGTTGEGVIYEAMNLAGAWKLPLLFMLERNGYAQSTATARTIAGDLQKRVEGFGLAFYKGDVWSPDALCRLARQAVESVRAGNGPALLEVECFRLNAHSKGDDNRPPDLVAAFREKDPVNRFKRDFSKHADNYAAEADATLATALAEISSVSCTYSPALNIETARVAWKPAATQSDGVRYGEALYDALKTRLSEQSETLLLGEDIEPPYGGAFKITRDLGDQFPGRVLNTPISEAGIVGLGAGLALGGFRPYVEIMFGDFLTLIFDQLQQHAAKFPVMYGKNIPLPLVVRSPSGGRRGYGPTHSQSLEKHFLGIPGLVVLACNHRLAPGDMYRSLGAATKPHLVIENKVLYTRPLMPPVFDGYQVLLSDETFPAVKLTPAGSQADVTIACYGGMLEIAEAALAGAFLEDEILCEIICCSRLHPLNLDPVFDSLKHTGRLLTLEEGPGFAGWGAELAAQATYAGIRMHAATRLAYDGLIPASAGREAALLPGVDAVRNALRNLMRHA